MSSATLRDFREADAVQVNRVALAAFDEFRSRYTDWSAMVSVISRMSALADGGEIIVAELDETIIGAVAYLPPGSPKSTLLRSVMADHSDARRQSRVQRLRGRPGIDRRMAQGERCATEWPTRRSAIGAWLADENFDEQGRARARLQRPRMRTVNLMK
jgi:hypothetical protein